MRALQQYRAKRSFTETPEPKGKKTHAPAKGVLSFVVQEHHASHLHYDFRLELDGVLISWAVPKGPTMDPSVKRLAIHVEDHPLQYGKFEGTIPKGQYGAGEVYIWDKGTYSIPGTTTKAEAQKEARRMLEKGDLKLFLHGEKLQGSFALVQMKNDPKGKQWLLIKKRDDDPLPTVSERAKKKAHDPMPHDIHPMLAHLVEQAFDGDDWLFEVKWDGYRAIAECEEGQVRLYSRNFLSFNDKFPNIVQALAKLDGTVLDGELVVLDAEGRSDFQLLQNYLRDPTSRQALRFYVFDMLYHQGNDLRDLPLLERKKWLKVVLKQLNSPLILYSDHVLKEGKKLFQEAVKKRIEGIIAKEIHSPYLPKRSKSWLKVKTHLRQEVVIAGFTQPRGSRKKLGALVVGVRKNGVLTYAGHVGGGFTQQSLKDVHAQLEPLVTPTCPFKKTPKTNTAVTWVKPKLVCEVSFQEWTQEGIMRQPIFQGMRLDKGASEVKQEVSVAQPVLKTTTKEAVTHPDKIYWPKEGYTKQDLIDYYQSVAPLMLPYLKDRPIMMFRFPHGIGKEGFVQKDAPTFLPEWIAKAEIQHDKKLISYILVQDVKSLLYVVNLASIEIHAFLSRYETLHEPDFLSIDLDPVHVAFNEVVDLAREVHSYLDHLQIPNFCKTSGKRGLHLFLPLGAKYDYEQVEDFSKLLAHLLHEQFPEITSLVRDPKKRDHKIYFDYLQNAMTKTMVAPYSVRAIEGAPVSTPLEWKEVKKGLDPQAFNIKTFTKRLKKGDLFKGVLGKGGDIAKILNKISHV